MVELSVYDPACQGYVSVKSRHEIKHQSRVQIVSGGENLWTQPPNAKWKPSPHGKAEDVVIYEGGNAYDKFLWNKLVDLLAIMSPSFDAGTFVHRAIAVRNQELMKGFTSVQASVRKRHVEKPELFNSSPWDAVNKDKKGSRSDDDRSQRHHFNNYLHEYADQFEENEKTTVSGHESGSFLVSAFHCLLFHRSQ